MTGSIVETARAEGRTLLSEVESKLLLQQAGIPTTTARLATSSDEAVAAAQAIGFPVVLKVVSPDITHKSDVGGVALGLEDAEAVAAAFERVTDAAQAAQPGARVQGVSVQSMAPLGIEVIAGVTRDPQFGPVLMFGLGGVLVEVLQDVAFRLIPLEPRDADELLREIRGFPLLQGYRGRPPADLEALRGLLLRLSEFVRGHPEIDELDLNPILVYSDGVTAVDARIVLGSA